MRAPVFQVQPGWSVARIDFAWLLPSMHTHASPLGMDLETLGASNDALSSCFTSASDEATSAAYVDPPPAASVLILLTNS